MRFVDAKGRTRLLFPADFAGGDVEVRRGDLAHVLYEHSRAVADYVFGDSISTMDEGDGGVDVTFAGGRRASFDIVVGADGIHSHVRYERLLRAYAEKCQRGGNRTGRFLAPLTARGRWSRDTLLSRKPLMDLMLRLGRDQATVELPDYSA
jgi:hypothetical protein